ncbi:hypothetical protein CDAR_518641 [Caerostris darwini]|uniref:Uncharacterized protein n=1 Tax=Caerostris darwini TaxID=1538125 RepID=A0AAV4UW28_9ARAC|nr:hypothetical protein CDAR_518641 [Caerostris darwini]
MSRRPSAEPVSMPSSSKRARMEEPSTPRNDYIQIVVPYLHNHATGRELMIWDLDAKGEFIQSRIEAYGKADIVLLCYNPIREKKKPATLAGIPQRESFVDTIARWNQEIRRYRTGVPVILVKLIRTMELGLCAPDDEYADEEAGQLYTDPEWSILTLTSRVEVLSRQSLDELFNKAVDIVLDRGVTPKETNNCGFVFD